MAVTGFGKWFLDLWPINILLLMFAMWPLMTSLSWALHLVSSKVFGRERYSWWYLWSRQSTGGEE